jgi:hypothetical protein
LLKGYGFFGETQKCPAMQLAITGPVSLEFGKNTANEKNPHSPYFIDPKKGLLNCLEESAIRSCSRPAGLVHRHIAFFFNMPFDILSLASVFLK